MNKPLMPKATAVWLVDNTNLTFAQIAEFCGLHPLEIQGIADGEVAKGIMGMDPVTNGQLSKEEISRCEENANAKLELSETASKFNNVEQKSKKSAKYTPVARRQDKPDAIAWLLQNCPEISDTQLIKLIGTTKNTIESVRSKSHWNIQNIRPKDPVLLGLCNQNELDIIVGICKKRAEASKQVRDDEMTQRIDLLAQ